MRIPALSQNFTLSQLYVDGMPLDDLSALYDYNTQVLGGTKWNGPNQFWASPARRSDNLTADVLDVGINAPALVNHFSFEVSKFPCEISLEWYDSTKKKWKSLLHKRNQRAIYLRITESVPRRIHEDVFDKSHRHPHHRAAGHWQTVEFDTKPVRTSRIRVLVNRLHNKNVPLGVGSGHPVPYSVAIKDFQYGYEVKDREDVPLTSLVTQVVADAPSFSSTTDLLGSNVEFGLTEYDAADLLWPAKAAIAGVPPEQRDGYGEIWKCEPQPYSYAVVNLYVDARDPDGNPQVIDRFFIDTTTNGVGCNLYYTDTDPDLELGFPAVDSPIRYPSVQAHGNSVSDANGVFFGDSLGYLDIDQASIQPDETIPGWSGVKFQPQFDSNEINDHVIISTPHFEIRWDGTNKFWVIDLNGQTVNHPTTTFVFNQTISVFVYRDVAQGRIAFDDGWGTTVNYAPGATRVGYDEPLDGDTSSPGLNRTRTIRFGAALAADVSGLKTGDYRLIGFVMKQEPIDVTTVADWMTLDATNYLLPADISAEEEYDYTHNALLRIHPFFHTVGEGSRNPYGVVGGPATAYESLVWTPINRDFRLSKGFFRFDPVHAKYFKFEFSNLSPQPYASYAPMARIVKLFTADTVYKSVLDSTSPADAPANAAMKVNSASSASPLFSDQARVQYLANPGRAYEGYTPTEALYSTDPGAQQRLAEINPAFRFQPWHRPKGMPRVVETKQHTYETVRVTHDSNIAYFVGLSELRMFKVDYTGVDDTDAYLITFHDRAGLVDDDPLPWNMILPNGMQAPPLPGTSYARTSSEILPSRRNVRGIQFATMQSPAAQILADPDFNDPDLKYWHPYAGALIESSADLNTDIGSTIKITRTPTGVYWDTMEENGTWDAIELMDPSPDAPIWDDLQSPPGSTQFGGVEGNIASLVQPAAGGRIYVAARVYAPTSLTAPLHLQLIDQDGNALAEAAQVPRAGGITEWYTGYTLGTAQTDFSNVPTWDEIEDSDPSPGLPTWDGLEAMGNWDQVMGELSETYTGPVTARLFQQDPTHDVWYVDNLSVYEDPIVWEFSNDEGITWYPAFDIKNNPDGVLLFPDDVPDTMVQTDNLGMRWRVTAYRPEVLVSALFIRPWYSTLRLGVPVRDELAHGGPNIAHYDQYPRINDWAPFKVWDRPIPQDWWFNFRQWLLQGGIPSTVPPVIPPTVVPFISDALVYLGTALSPMVLTEVLVLPNHIVLGDGLVLPG